ncbi:MAG TPA: hypothetical protein VMW87_03925, partial [Spirochaetia bacterium]|nr:hypothetical protein [Spirochaetia bacterium]
MGRRMDMDRQLRTLIDKWAAGEPLSDTEMAQLRESEARNPALFPRISVFSRLVDRDVRAQAGIKDVTRDKAPFGLEGRIMGAIEGRSPVRSRKTGNPVRAWSALPVGARRMLQVALPAAVLVVGFLLGVGYARSPGGEGAPIASMPDTVTVTFRLAAPEAATVSLVGDFNDWKANSYRMKDVRHDGVWEITVPLQRGHVYT